MSASVVTARRPVLITGGAGFIGSNLANRLLGLGNPVIILDNLSRPGVQRNLEFLSDRHGSKLEVLVADVRDAVQVRNAVRRASAVFHLAAQVAVTTSLDEPRRDFEINALGTLNVLEALRETNKPAPLLYTSTNKVYGAISDVVLEDVEKRCAPVASSVAQNGIGEERPLDFHSPYGCSKGTADQYVRDYARSFGLFTVVFRMSCIYGPHQFGNEDQGWVAHFIRRALAGESITLYGDGRQVRDALFVEDLVDAMLLASDDARRLAGSAFNIGGGPTNTISLLELLEQIKGLTGKPCQVSFEEPRIGDQRYYVSDVRAFKAKTGWQPITDTRTGILRLAEWIRSLPSASQLSRQEQGASG
jgi:CDP-paratose 2-epimerase